MDIQPLILLIGNQPGHQEKQKFSSSLKAHLLELDVVDHRGSRDRQTLLTLDSWCSENEVYHESTPVLVINAPKVELSNQAFHLWGQIDKIQPSGVLFSADRNFIPNESPYEYFLWKYYPRDSGAYPYLNGSMILGNLGAICSLVQEVKSAYEITMDSEVSIETPYFSRYYVESFLEIYDPVCPIVLDANQAVFSSMEGSIELLPLPRSNWVIEHFSNLSVVQNSRYFRKLLPYRNSEILIKQGSVENKLTKSNPFIVSYPYDKRGWSVEALWVIFKELIVWILSYIKMAFVWMVNYRSLDQRSIFRYKKHSNPHYEKVARTFVKLMEERKPFTFAHFNDGELNFIRKYLQDDHKRTWTGRRQNQYDPELTERLIEAIKHRQVHYHVGVNCTTCGTARRHVADELMGDYPFKISSMVMHHNLFYLPKMLSLMKDREVFFVINEHQDLTFLSDFGLKVKDENKIIVPFVNSYYLYDKLKDTEFPEESVVLLMCGMLAKILNKVWYEQNPTCTFIAYGSTMDDFIQKTNTYYTVFPKRLPLTHNLFIFKSFLFGAKKECEECYHFAD